MKETIFLIVSRSKVEDMRKNLPRLSRGQIPIKLNIEVKPNAFTEPTIERDVVVEDWKHDIDFNDVLFEKSTITAKEADIIKKNRLERMQEILESEGYSVQKLESHHDDN